MTETKWKEAKAFADANSLIGTTGRARDRGRNLTHFLLGCQAARLTVYPTKMGHYITDQHLQKKNIIPDAWCESVVTIQTHTHKLLNTS